MLMPPAAPAAPGTPCVCREDSTLELLKRRFGEAALGDCDIMVCGAAAGTAWAAAVAAASRCEEQSNRRVLRVVANAVAAARHFRLQDHE